MRLSSSRVTSLTHRPQQDFPLWDKAGSRPSLDLQFADRKDLVDATTGSNLVAFTRQSSGTYVGSDGLIKTATTNLLLWSEELDHAGWYPIGTVTATLDSSQGTPIDGSPVYRVDFSTANEQWRQTLTFQAATYAASIYVKGTPGETIRLAIPGAIAINETLNGDWQRISVIGSVAAGTNHFSITTAANATARTIYATAAQLEQSTTVGEYIKTTSTINSAPRFDHDPETGESLGLLVEESRTNLLTDSEDLSGYSTADVTVPFDSSAINPTGSTGSHKILADFGVSSNGVRIRDIKSSSNNIVVSAFVKKSTHRYIYVGFGGIANSFTALFDIEPGLTSNRLLGESGNGTFTNIDAGYQNFPNDWIRIWAVGTTSGTDGPTVGMGPDATTFNITNWTAAGTEEIYAWGLQYEDDKSFPTSYIPTTGSTVTRAADVASISGSNLSGWYNDNEGSGFIEAFTAFTGATGANFYRFGLFINNIRVARSGSGTTPQLLVAENSATQASPYAGFLQPNVFAKIIAAYKVDDFAISTNGSSPSGSAVDTSGSVPQGLTSAVLMDGNSGCVRRFTYWPQRLPNSTLQTITQ
jgi:hypothetical protein